MYISGSVRYELVYKKIVFNCFHDSNYKEKREVENTEN